MSHVSPFKEVENHNLPYDENEEDYQEFEEYDEVTKPQSRPFYKRRKYWIFCAIMTVILVAIIVPIALFVILPKIAQVIINGSNMSFKSVQITNPTNTSLTMAMDGVLGNTGPFSATIKFPQPIEVYYNDNLLGTMNLPDTKASGGKGNLNAAATFTINDESAFGSFAADMMGKESFTWVLKSTVTIVALGRTVPNLNLNKELVLAGMNGLPNVQILKFDLPSDAADGQGINMVIDTAMNNPSPIGVVLGTLVLDISYNGTALGRVKATDATLAGGAQSVLNLTGIMYPQTTPENLATVSSLFSSYIGGLSSETTAQGVSVLPDGTNEVSWLSVGLKSMVLKVPLQSPTPLNIIQSIALGQMGMNWTNTDAYAPLANSPNVVAGFQMPFGFTLNVTQVQTNMNVVYNSKVMASLNSSNWGTALTTKDENNSTFINFALPPTPFMVGADSHNDFDTFVNTLTIGSSENFTVQGAAGTVAQTPIGQVTITGVPFNAGVALSGLQGLKTNPTVINGLTVIGGLTSGLEIALNLTMTNPSSLTIDTGVGDSAIVTFALQYEGDNVGSVIFPTLNLVPGENHPTVGALFTPTGTAGGAALLQRYMTNQVSTVNIYGSASSSAIAPLAAGLKDIQLSSDMPGLSAQLLAGTALTILNDTGTTGIAMATVTINNPFIPALTIKSIKSTVQYNSRQLGTIDLPSTSISVAGMSQQASPALPLTMDLAIDSLISLMIDQAKVNNLDAAPITALGEMAKDPTVKVSSSVFAGFNLPNFVKAAMVGLKVDVTMTVDVLVGEYATSLTLTQAGVPTSTDDTILKLIPIVGTPIAQAIVNQAVLSFTSLMINSPAETDFTTNINGLIANTGPFDADIAFSDGCGVSWINGGSNSSIGQIAMPTVSAKADVGATLAMTNVPFHVTSGTNMGDFVGYSLKAENFEWAIYATNMVVTAMGAAIPGINMSKTVTLKGFNGLKELTIQKYDLPSNDADGIHLTLSATLANPSNIGIEMGTVLFDNIFDGQYIGYVQTVGLTLQPNANSPLSLEGSMTKQTTDAGLEALGKLFNLVLSGGSPALTVQGKSVTPASGPVSWLSSAFSSLALNVTLPSIGKQEIITGITMKTMSLDFTGSDAYTVDTSSDNIEASYHIPFAFPLNITKVSESLYIQMPQGTNVASLSLPEGDASTISAGVLKTAYSNQPLKVLSDQHSTFNQFTEVLTVGPGVTFYLSGTANTLAETAAGPVTIPGISVNVASTLAGMNLNSGASQITDIKVVGGTSEYLAITQNVVLQNPSGLTVNVGEVSFNIAYKGIPMGAATVSKMVLAPGNNTLPASFHLQPPSSAVRDAFLSGFVSGATFDLAVTGSDSSTSIASLKAAMAAVKLSASITGITDKLVAPGSTAAANAINMAQPFVARETPVQVMIYNPFDTPLYIESMVANCVWNGIAFGTINQNVGLTVPAKSTALTSSLTMVSPTGVGFLPTVIEFIVKNLGLLTGPQDIPFDITSTIVAKVGGADGYLGNVAYSQKDTMIKVTLSGSIPSGLLAKRDDAEGKTLAELIGSTDPDVVAAWFQSLADKITAQGAGSL
ncbi:hypothetical protein BGZ80_003570 [Entomortierella chlamydospora]|uniref:Pre-rrna processing protein n=1 Tax=Entomortierella chlamydospora TaxID=101097 RepID=A0A9P6SWV7_9FUNG|nr:hypothetical protein BGZ79_002711 [Entomortierella chlamydospora]KAG0008338.1 hypothetical protein BGZ80_003570 [Entomortierella chlamydospora]